MTGTYSAVTACASTWQPHLHLPRNGTSLPACLCAAPTALHCVSCSQKGLMCGISGQQVCCRSPNVCVGGTQCVNLGTGSSMLFAPGALATQQQLQAATPECSGDTILVKGRCCAPGSVCNGEAEQERLQQSISTVLGGVCCMCNSAAHFGRQIQ